MMIFYVGLMLVPIDAAYHIEELGGSTHSTSLDNKHAILEGDDVDTIKRLGRPLLKQQVGN